MIELEHIYKRFGNLYAVSDLTFRVPSGQIVGFLGPNGAGKSTTMKMITGLLAPTAGNIRVCGHDIFDDTMKVKECIGFLPESPPLYHEMLVEDFLQFVAEIRGVHSKSIKSRVDHVLSHCQLTHVRGRLIGNLSKGYKQRVGIAQAIIHDPQVIILDEPTIGLDPAQILEIRKLIKSFAQVRTVILSTHILQEVTAVCDRVVVINEGKLVADRMISHSMTKDKDQLFMLDVIDWTEDPIQVIRQIPLVDSIHRAGSQSTEVVIKLKQPVEDVFELVKELNQKNIRIRTVRPTHVNIEDFYLGVISGQGKELSV
jgi:ABC-2 type transport system ATP-binding protein